MVGSGFNRSDGLVAINSTNIFSALESRRRKSSKKKSDKSNLTTKETEAPPLPPVWRPVQVSVRSWADCEEDDDDFFATAAPLPPLSSTKLSETTDHAIEANEESDSDAGAEEDTEDDVEDESTTDISEAKNEVISPKTVSVVTTASREPEKQLSKKEKKKKELAELEAVLAEFAADGTNTNGLVELGAEKKQSLEASVEENKENGFAVTESKNVKRRKPKKEKSSKETKDENANPAMSTDEGTKDTQLTTVPTDPKEVLKKLASQKKKKKDIDGAAKAAAAEASVRAAKLAAAKKKEKAHYNQQPVK